MSDRVIGSLLSQARAWACGDVGSPNGKRSAAVGAINILNSSKSASNGGGASDGLEEELGNALGIDDGPMVGCADGAGTGSELVGTNDGLREGTTLGFLVGGDVGGGMYGMVGRSVGDGM